MTGTATLNVEVTDINDNAPDFPANMPQVTVGPSTTEGSVVTTFTVVDPDSQANGAPFTVTYCTSQDCDRFTMQQQGTYLSVTVCYIQVIQHPKKFNLKYTDR